jgi:guanyl-specific ribonuclease Sa
MKPPSGKRPTPLLAVLAVLAALAGSWWATRSDGPAPAPQPAPQGQGQPAPAPLAADPAQWPPGTRAIPYAAGSDRSVEIARTLDRIERGGPFPYERDGQEFQNRERRLPAGEYLEYTVQTPGASDRGARRLVVDQDDGVVWYSDDHYESFAPVARLRLP